jgi:two-component system OmpR family sensor kinase
MTRTKRRRPLRVKLTVLMLLLLSLGLLVSSLLATAALRGYLIDRIDEQLIAGSRPFQTFGRLPPAPVDGGGGRSDLRPPSLFHLEIVYADGSTGRLLSTPTSDPGGVPATPPLADLPSLAGQPVTVSSVAGSDQWRMLVTPTPGGAGWAVAAYPLVGLEGTVRRLVALQLLVGAIVVGFAGVIGFALVRRSLRPLDDVAAAAREIASGDLSRRVPDDSSTTEVHELSSSFNVMVSRIEESFAAQQESESQARASEIRMRGFIADAGHELRTPLTSIRGYAELLEQGAADDPDVAVARIQGEAARMALLVDDLQLLARLDQQPQLDMRPLDLRDVVLSAVDGAKAAQPDRPISLHVVDGSLEVSGDARQLRQVMDNLLSNALRYSPDGTPIDVTAIAVGDDVRVDVVDRGPGLTAHQAERVFERLYRTDDARSRVHGGSGLGLSIVKSIVEAHGGSVIVESTPGEGSTFGFVLPGTAVPA